MTTTRSTTTTIMEHILEVVFNQPPDSPLHRALKRNGYVVPEDFLMESDDNIDELDYIDDNGKKETIIRGHAGLLKMFKQFVAHQHNQGNDYLLPDDWKTITNLQFNNFRSTNANRSVPIVPTPAAVTSSNIRQPPSVDLVREFKHGIKRDVTQFIALKDDAAWDNWNRSTTAQAQAQDIAEVLDPNYVPTTIYEILLFEQKQKFKYAVFENTLLTDKGKALVRLHQHTHDAQSIYKELLAYAQQSTKASMNASNLLSYISTTRLDDGKWKGTTHAFILHWQDQVRKYHDLNPQQVLLDDFLKTLLQSAVHPIAELRQVKLQAEQFKTHTGKDLSYQEYTSLLLSAAQQYDEKDATKGNKFAKRCIYEHNIFPDAEFEDAVQVSIPNDIDWPFDLIEVNATK